MPEIKAQQGFGQKMAAAFALELEQETERRNKAWLQRNKSQLLPEPQPDFSRKFL